MYFVSDGIGGHGGGEIASRLAVEAVRRASDTKPEDMSIAQAEKFVFDTLAQANQSILDHKKENPILNGSENQMGATGVLALEVYGPDGKPKLVIGNIGDSGAGIAENGEFKQLTIDDDYIMLATPARRGESEKQRLEHVKKLQEIADGLADVSEVESVAGIDEEERKILHDALDPDPVKGQLNVVYASLGKANPHITVATHDFPPGARLALYSDGISGNLTRREIGMLLGESKNSEEAARKLFDKARERGDTPEGDGHKHKDDDITITVAG